MKIKLMLASLFLGMASLVASEVMVKDAYVRATPPNMPNSAAFMLVMNKSANDVSIVSVKSSVAQKAELHTHDMVNGMMKMHQVSKVDIKANAHTMFAPGSFHVMFLGLNKALKEGDSVDFTLVLSSGKEIKINAPVKKVMAGMNHGKMNSKNMNHGNAKMNHGKM